MPSGQDKELDEDHAKACEAEQEDVYGRGRKPEFPRRHVHDAVERILGGSVQRSNASSTARQQPQFDQMMANELFSSAKTRCPASYTPAT